MKGTKTKYHDIGRRIFEIVYWVGGEEQGEWKRTTHRFEGRDLAGKSKHTQDIQRMGYQTKVLRTRDIEQHGLPTTLR